MKEAEMERIAVLIKQVIMDKKPPGKIKKDVKRLAKEFHGKEYCFAH